MKYENFGLEINFSRNSNFNLGLIAFYTYGRVKKFISIKVLYWTIITLDVVF